MALELRRDGRCKREDLGLRPDQKAWKDRKRQGIQHFLKSMTA